MASWKSRQKAYHLMNPIESMKDDLSKRTYQMVEDDHLLENILLHFRVHPDEFYYPSKSYVVAIVYARLLVDHFNVDFYEVLNDEELLFNNDPYFTPYLSDKGLYDSILDSVGMNFDLTVGAPAHIAPYFYEEFLIKEVKHDR